MKVKNQENKGGAKNVNKKAKLNTKNKINKKKPQPNNNAKAKNINDALKKGDIIINNKVPPGKKGVQKTGDIKTKTQKQPTSPITKEQKKLEKFGGTNKFDVNKNVEQNKQNKKGIKQETSSHNKNANKDQVEASNKNSKRKLENEALKDDNKKNKNADTTKSTSNEQKNLKTKKRRKEYKMTLASLREKVLQGDEEAIQKIKEKLAVLQTKPSSKTNKKKSRIFKSILNLDKKNPGLQNLGKKNPGLNLGKQHPAKKSLSKPLAKLQENKTKTNNKAMKNEKIQDEEDSSSESDYNVEETIKPQKIAKGMNEGTDSSNQDSSEENQESDGAENLFEESDDDDNDDEETEKSANGNKIASPNAKSNKKVRYIVFVGNLPYDADSDMIKSHFNKVGQVQHVRVPLDKQTNKPRGFAYVEFSTSKDYEKALSLHHTTVGGRRINVEYTKVVKKGENVKKEVMAKKLKLQALRDQGKLAGSVKKSQKRSARRAKSKGNN